MIMIVVEDVAIMHSAMVARNETIIAVLMVPIKHLHCSNAISCNAWYTLSLVESRRIGSLSAKAFGRLAWLSDTLKELSPKLSLCPGQLAVSLVQSFMAIRPRLEVCLCFKICSTTPPS